MKKLYTGIALAVTLGLAVVATPVSANPNTSCVDGSNRDNLVDIWTGDNTVQVKTESGRPVCSDVTLYFSSYSMPANYNGEKFWQNETAYPQYVFDSKKMVLAEGQTQTEVVTINLPDNCTHKQVDVYLGPEITEVGAEGHMKRAIGSRIIQKTQDNCTPAQTEQPKPAKELPAVLPETGSPMAIVAGISTLTAAVSAAGMHLVRRRAL